jgi:hypothetical protein
MKPVSKHLSPYYLRKTSENSSQPRASLRDKMYASEPAANLSTMKEHELAKCTGRIKYIKGISAEVASLLTSTGLFK